METYNYYKEQISRLDKDSEIVYVKIQDGNGDSTKFLHINKESIDLIIGFLQNALNNQTINEDKQ
jgi:hypothetical protein